MLRTYETFTRRNWAFVTALVSYADSSSTNASLNGELRDSLDIYHALGVVRTSCWLTWLAGGSIRKGYHPREVLMTRWPPL